MTLRDRILDPSTPVKFFELVPPARERARAIERTIADGKQSVVFPLREYWIDVGRLDDLQRASDEFQRIFG